MVCFCVVGVYVHVRCVYMCTREGWVCMCVCPGLCMWHVWCMCMRMWCMSVYMCVTVCVCTCLWCVCAHSLGATNGAVSAALMEKIYFLESPSKWGPHFCLCSNLQVARCFNRPVSCETGWSSSQSIHSGCPCGPIWRPSCFIWIWKGRRQSIILAVYPTAFSYRDFPSFLSSRRILSLPKSPVTNIPVQSQWQ